VPDNDAPGRNYLQKVAAEIYPGAKSVRVVELPGLGEGEDIEDWLPKHEREEFFAAIDAAPEWRPDGNAVNLSITRPTTDIAPVTGEEKLNRLLAEYAIVLVGGSARIIGWKRRRLYAGDGGEHEVPNLIRPDAFRLFHRDKFQAIKGADGKTGRQQLANLFLDQARRFDDLVFIPGADPTVGNQLNLCARRDRARQKGEARRQDRRRPRAARPRLRQAARVDRC
jgi:DNA primase